jgi:adenosylhomocysteine nucleosidase
MVALLEEARGILKAGCWSEAASSGSHEIYERRAGDGKVVLVVSGVGRVQAESATRAVLEERRPSAVLSLGFAGGLVADQRAGDLVVARVLIPAEDVLDGDPKPRISEALGADRTLSDKALGVLATLGLRHRTGACVTASRIVSRPEAKRRLGSDTDALAVEMESFWVALACRERNVPFLAVRAVVDTVGRPLPDFLAASEPDASSGNRWRRGLPFMFRPWSLPALIRLGSAASKARNSLAAFTSGFLKAWPCPVSKRVNCDLFR